jgi:hypothetical protein
MHGLLLLEVGTPEEANISMQDGLLHARELKDCKLFMEDCTMTQCYKCYRHGHTAKTCIGRRYCENCAKEHNSRSCLTSKLPATFSCCNYKSEYTAWSSLCPEQVAQESIAATAYAARPSWYNILAKFSSDISCSLLPPLPLLPTLLPFKPILPTTKLLV